MLQHEQCPRDVKLVNRLGEPTGYLEMEIFQLLRKPCKLGSVKSVTVCCDPSLCDHFLMGALFARICAEATALEKLFT